MLYLSFCRTFDLLQQSGNGFLFAAAKRQSCGNEIIGKNWHFFQYELDWLCFFEGNFSRIQNYEWKIHYKKGKCVLFLHKSSYFKVLIPNLPKICRKPWIFATIFAAICLNEFAAANFAAMDLPLAAAMRQIDMYKCDMIQT